MTTKEVAERFGVAEITVRKWCAKYAVSRKLGAGGIMRYEILEKDLLKFDKRKPKGRPRAV